MTSGEFIAYHNIFKMLNNHCLTFHVYKTTQVGGNNMFNSSIYFTSCTTANTVNEESVAYTGLNGPTQFATKTNTNMHNYEHTFLHNPYPKRN